MYWCSGVVRNGAKAEYKIDNLRIDDIWSPAAFPGNRGQDPKTNWMATELTKAGLQVEPKSGGNGPQSG